MDPYLHLPHLRGRIRPAEQCGLRLTPEGLALWDLRAREIGHQADWRLSDEAREADRRALLGQRDASRDLWIYAYGSLMWDPGIHFAEVRLAELAGHQRRFTLQLKLGRGSPERPGLVSALEPQARRVLGSNRDYLEQLVAQLAALDIEDPYVSELLRHLPAHH